MTEVFLDYLHELTDELLAEGRRPIIWGDMFLYDHGEGYDKYHFHCKNEEIEKLLFEKADRRVLIADWEYNATKTPLHSSLLFKEQGFEDLALNGSAKVYTSTTATHHNYPDYNAELGFMLPIEGDNTKESTNCIDHIMMPDCSGVEVGVYGVVVDECSMSGSDHYPIFADVTL